MKTYTGYLKIDATHSFLLHQGIFIWILKINHITSEGSNPMLRAEIYWHYSTGNMKDLVPGNVFGGTFSDSFCQRLLPHSHYRDILQSSSCQIWDFLPSFVEVYWPGGMKFVYPTINLAYLGIIVKGKFSMKFSLRSFECFRLQISSEA